MARDPLAGISTITTPQTQRIPGRTDQVLNNAGGYVFAKDTWERVEDFILLGTCGGTYYVGEDKLTADNADVLFVAVAEDGPRVVNLIVAISTARPPRAPKPARPSSLSPRRSPAATSTPARPSRLLCRWWCGPRIIWRCSSAT